MTIEASVSQLPSEREYVRMVSSGHVTGDEARALAARLLSGGDLAGRPMLSIMDGKVDLSSEARKAYGSLNGAAGDTPQSVAVVTSSAPLRVLMSFVLRISGAAQHTRLFGDEAAALAWLQTV